MANGYRGEVMVQIGEKKHTLRFGWSAVATLQQEIGVDFDQQIQQAINTLDLTVLAKTLAIGLRDSWPDVTAEKIIDLSPPIAMVTNVITLGLKRSFHGMEEVPAPPGENPPPGRLKMALAKLIPSLAG